MWMNGILQARAIDFQTPPQQGEYPAIKALQFCLRNNFFPWEQKVVTLTNNHLRRVIKEIFAIWCFLYHFKIWPPSYQKQFYWRTVWCTKIYPIFHKVVRLKPADSLSKWIYAPKLWDVKYFMASAGDVMAGTVLTNDPRCSRCQPEIGGAARKTTRDARYDSRGKLSQRRGTGGWNVSLLQFRHLFYFQSPLPSCGESEDQILRG